MKVKRYFKLMWAVMLIERAFFSEVTDVTYLTAVTLKLTRFFRSSIVKK